MDRRGWEHVAALWLRPRRFLLQQWGRCLMTINVRFAAESGMEDMLWMASVSRFVQMATFLAFGSKLCIAAFRQSRIVATCIHKLGIHLAVSVVRRSSSLLSSSRPRPVLGKDPTTRSHLADHDHDRDASCSYRLCKHVWSSVGWQQSHRSQDAVQHPDW